jgi:5-formyltetrahydrofolate cyclo-ligase
LTSRSELRRALRAERRSLTVAEQRRHAALLARVLRKHPAFLRARRIGAYLSSDGELDLADLLSLAQTRHKRCYLPVLRPHPKKKLWFVRYRSGDRLTANVYGIPEPRLRNRHIRLPWALDILLMPLVGFDAAGNRLGMGGGYYDRTLAYLLQRRRWRRPTLIGVAHECQRVERLAPAPWDVPLDLVATEKGVWEVEGRGKRPEDPRGPRE